MGQEIHKMSLEHFVVPESKEVLKKKSIDVGYVKRAQEPNLEQFEPQNKLVLDYNPKDKISIHEVQIDITY